MGPQPVPNAGTPCLRESLCKAVLPSLNGPLYGGHCLADHLALLNRHAGGVLISASASSM